jgi:hypothetical protein
VRLCGVFFLVRADKDHAESVGSGQSAALLFESSEQAWWGMSPHLSREKLPEVRLQRLEHICVLAKAVPTYTLGFSSTGEFWKEIDRAMADGETGNERNFRGD